MGDEDEDRDETEDEDDEKEREKTDDAGGRGSDGAVSAGVEEREGAAEGRVEVAAVEEGRVQAGAKSSFLSTTAQAIRAEIGARRELGLSVDGDAGAAMIELPSDECGTQEIEVELLGVLGDESVVDGGVPGATAALEDGAGHEAARAVEGHSAGAVARVDEDLGAVARDG